jgi:hypothetical protein
MKKADHHKDGQLGADSALLAIGAFHLSRSDMMGMQRGVEQYVAQKGSRRRHLYGIMISTVGAICDGLTSMADGSLQTGIGAHFQPFSESRLSFNPHYRGPVRVTSFPGAPSVLENFMEIPPRS